MEQKKNSLNDCSKNQTSILIEAGAYGGITHLYNASELSFKELLDVFKLLSTGQISPTEKIDGINIMLSYRNGRVYAARNKSQLNKGGLTADEVAQLRFETGDDAKNAIVKAISAFEESCYSLSEAQLSSIFGKYEKIFFNFEIVDTNLSNLINYNSNFLFLHTTGHKFWDPKSQKTLTSSKIAPYYQEFVRNLNQFNNNQGYSVEKTPKIENLSLNSQELTSLEQHLLHICDMEGLSLQNKIKSMRLDRTKHNLKKIITYFGSKLLKSATNTRSDLENNKNIKKMLNSTIKLAKSYTGPDSFKVQNTLQRNLDMLGPINSIDTVIEGIVFTYNGKLYKITGNFAAINQIMGLYKYGKGDAPPLKDLERRHG